MKAVQNYITSKDYKHLKELLDSGIVVVGFTTYDFNRFRKAEPDYNPIIVTDVCLIRLINKGTQYERYDCSVRGTGFGDYWTVDSSKYSFEEYCEHLQLQYIEPTKLQPIND